MRDIENFLPLFRVQRRWKDGSKRMLQLPLFSNYIFVRIGREGRSRMLGVPGVVSIVVEDGNQQRFLNRILSFSRKDFAMAGSKHIHISPRARGCVFVPDSWWAWKASCFIRKIVFAWCSH